MYKVNAPNETEITDINVPIHLPNKIPEKIVIGEPNPNKTVQIMENIKNKKRLK